MIADSVLCESLDLGVGEAGSAKVSQSVLEQLPPQALIAERSIDREIGNVADSGLAILPGGDVADNLAVVFRDENAGRFAGHIHVNMPSFAPSPVVAVDRPKSLFNAVVDGDALKAFDGN